MLRNRTLASSALVLLFLGCLSAAEKPYQAATITDVQQKTNTRVLYYVVNTPITKDEPYFEISVQMKDMAYVGRYMPRHANDALPEEWKPGFTLQARMEGHRLFLKRPSGAEMQLTIVKKSAATGAEAGTAPK